MMLSKNPYGAEIKLHDGESGIVFKTMKDHSIVTTTLSRRVSFVKKGGLWGK